MTDEKKKPRIVAAVVFFYRCGKAVKRVSFRKKVFSLYYCQHEAGTVLSSVNDCHKSVPDERTSRISLTVCACYVLAVRQQFYMSFHASINCQNRWEKAQKKRKNDT